MRATRTSVGEVLQMQIVPMCVCTSMVRRAVVGENSLSCGSDCDAVWLSPRRMKTPIAG
jgi:hypothetical protein